MRIFEDSEMLRMGKRKQLEKAFAEAELQQGRIGRYECSEDSVSEYQLASYQSDQLYSTDSTTTTFNYNLI